VCLQRWPCWPYHPCWHWWWRYSMWQLGVPLPSSRILVLVRIKFCMFCTYFSYCYCRDQMWSVGHHDQKWPVYDGVSQNWPW
jgi:hypothetical protein